MPTPDGRKSVQDAIDNGMPFVLASGIENVIYHEAGCTPYAPTCCGTSAVLRRLAMEFDHAIEDFGPSLDASPVPGGADGAT
jgi:hypothetical protein